MACIFLREDRRDMVARYHFATRFKGDKMQMIDHWIDSLGSFHLKEIDVLRKDKRFFF